MRIRWKSLLILYLVTLVVTLAFYLISDTSLLQRVKSDEQKTAEDNLVRLKSALASETKSLASKSADWSHWDDSYQFVQDNNTQFIETNLVPQTFSDLNINMMVFVNNAGSIVFGEAYYIDNMTEMPIERTSIKSVIDAFNQSPDNESQLEGFLKTNEGTMLVVASQIVKSNYEGPEKGMLIFGILFDNSVIADITNTVGLPVNWVPIDNTEMTTDFLVANSTLAKGTQPFATSTTETELSAFATIEDINSNPIVLVSITDGRQSYIETNSEIFSISIAITLMGFIFLAASYFSLDRFVLSRLSNLDDDVKRITESGNMKDRTQTKGNDEVSSLSRRIDSLLEQINISQAKINDYSLTLEQKIEEKKNELEEANIKLDQNRRMATIGEIAGMVGHDLRNPLSGMKNAVFLLKKKYRPLLGEDGIELLLIMDNAIEHSNDIINDLLDYSREMHLDYEEISPKSLISYTLLAINIPGKIKVLQHVEDLPTIWVDTNKMQRVFANLVKNAIDAMPDGGSLEISSRHHEQSVNFLFIDTGCGMSKDVAKKIFTPLFTTKAKGMGFGLSICKRIVESHGGKIEVESTLNKGTKFTIIFPIKPKSK